MSRINIFRVDNNHERLDNHNFTGEFYDIKADDVWIYHIECDSDKQDSLKVGDIVCIFDDDSPGYLYYKISKGDSGTFLLKQHYDKEPDYFVRLQDGKVFYEKNTNKK